MYVINLAHDYQTGGLSYFYMPPLHTVYIYEDPWFTTWVLKDLRNLIH